MTTTTPTTAGNPGPIPNTLRRRSLDELVKVIKTEVNAIIDAERSIIETQKKIGVHYMRVGEALNEAKSVVKHGEWASWLKDNFATISERSAQRYMELATGRPTIEQKLKEKSAEMKAAAKSATVADLTVADLTLNQAVRLLKPDGDDDNPSDKYDKAQKKLIERLQDLPPNQAEAAVTETIRELKKTLAVMTKVAIAKAA
jgi:hypothetical protein